MDSFCTRCGGVGSLDHLENFEVRGAISGGPGACGSAAMACSDCDFVITAVLVCAALSVCELGNFGLCASGCVDSACSCIVVFFVNLFAFLFLRFADRRFALCFFVVLDVWCDCSHSWYSCGSVM